MASEWGKWKPVRDPGRGGAAQKLQERGRRCIICRAAYNEPCIYSTLIICHPANNAPATPLLQFLSRPSPSGVPDWFPFPPLGGHGRILSGVVFSPPPNWLGLPTGLLSSPLARLFPPGLLSSQLARPPPWIAQLPTGHAAAR
jgi:hypothetical protein